MPAMTAKQSTNPVFLTERAIRLGVTNADLVDAVFDAAAQRVNRRRMSAARRPVAQADAMWIAHDVNSKGLYTQVSYLLDAWGAEEVDRMLHRMVGK